MKALIYILIFIVLIFALRLGELYTQLARYQKYWDYQNKLPVESNDFVYVAFGDSAAQGIGASSPSRGYVGLIAKQIEKDTAKNVRTINLSKSGARVRDVTETQLPKYNELKRADLITIEIGANDILSFDPNQFRQEVSELMQKLPKGTVISDIPSFKGGRLARLEPRVIEANKIIHELADERGIKLVELHKKISNNHDPRTLAADFFHPSNYGYRTNWASAFLEEIKID